jgi:hypothetical protein
MECIRRRTEGTTDLEAAAVIDLWGLVVVRARDLKVDEAQWGKSRMRIMNRHRLLRIPPYKNEGTK